MCLINKLNNRYLIFIEIILIFAINVTHIVFGFLIKVKNFSIQDFFGSSPLFDFSINSDCEGKSAIVFHKWEGRLEYEWTINDHLLPTKEAKIVDKTDLKKINGNYFCYKHISYKDLLYNGQIIKKGDKCPSKFKKNCGRLDTLEQELCINETENCPLYDVGLGSPPDSDNYTYVSSGNVYYNNGNYNNMNQKIIGKLVLNDGQPCYNETEKLWRQFSSKEAFETNLKCDIEIFGKFNDDRYEERGEISYKSIYKDNLNLHSQSIVVPYLTGNETVHLYKREFFGIDKECDKKSNFNDDTYDSLHDNEQSEYYLLIIEGIFLALISLSFLITSVIIIAKYGNDGYLFPGWLNCILFSVFMAMLLCCLICHTVFYRRVTSNNLTGYDCSDPITNEIIRKLFAHSLNNILYIKINFFLDLGLFAGNCLVLLIGFIWEIIEKCLFPINKNHDSKAETSQTKNEKSNEKSDMNINMETKASETPSNTYNPNPN